MIVSNLTFCIENSNYDEFEKFIFKSSKIFQEKHNFIIETKSFRILTVVDDQSKNISTQFFFKTQLDYQFFETHVLKTLLNEIDILFGGKYAYFPTKLQLI